MRLIKNNIYQKSIKDIVNDFDFKIIIIVILLLLLCP